MKKNKKDYYCNKCKELSVKSNHCHFCGNGDVELDEYEEGIQYKDQMFNATI